MIVYFRRISDVNIYLYIDDEFMPRSQCFEISLLLKTYNMIPCEEIKLSGNVYKYIIYGKGSKINTFNTDYYTICDYNEDNWLFNLMIDLESFYEDILHAIIIHGSCVEIENRNIFLIGERWSGKTTLVKYMADEIGGIYMCDDCTYIIKNSFYGFAMPLLQRIQTEGMQSNSGIIDRDGVQRSIFSPIRTKGYTKRIDLIVFPEYDKEINEQIVVLNKMDSYIKIMKSIRSYNSINELYYEINRIVREIKCISIKYNSSENAYKIINKYM